MLESLTFHVVIEQSTIYETRALRVKLSGDFNARMGVEYQCQHDYTGIVAYVMPTNIICSNAIQENCITLLFMGSNLSSIKQKAISAYVVSNNDCSIVRIAGM
jgi:hypothetical protein